MGAPMASRLVGHVDRLLVHDISPAAVDALVAKGAEAAGSAAALGEQVRDRLHQPADPADRARRRRRGDRRAAAPRIVCDLSTSGPKLAQELHDTLTPRGVASFDAPVSGGIRGAELGSLAIMVGGPEALYEDVRPLLDRIGNPFYMGETPGRGPGGQARQQPAQPRRDRHHRRGDDAGDQGRARSGADDRGAQRRHRRQLGHARQVAARGAAAHVRLRLLRRSSASRTPASRSTKRRRWACRCRPASASPRCSTATLATYGDDADFTAMAKVVEADAGLDPAR